MKTKEFFQDRRLCARAPVFRGLHLLKMRFLRMVREHGMFTPDGALGITLTGSLNERRLERLLRRLPEGTWELVCHPAYRDEQLRRLSKLRTGEEEIAALTSPRIRQCLQESGIQLTSYAALLQPAGAAGGEAGG